MKEFRIALAVVVAGGTFFTAACGDGKPLPTPLPRPGVSTPVPNVPPSSFIESISQINSALFSEKQEEMERNFSADRLINLDGSLSISQQFLGDYIKASAIIYAEEYKKRIGQSIASETLTGITHIVRSEDYQRALRNVSQSSKYYLKIDEVVTVGFDPNAIFVNAEASMFDRRVMQNKAKTDPLWKKYNPEGNPLKTLGIMLMQGFNKAYPLR